MTWRAPFTVLRMPSGMKELIQFSLDPIQVSPCFDAEDVLAYRLSYASGQHLTGMVLFVARHYWLFWRRPAMCLSVVDADERMRIRSRYTLAYVRAPNGPHDMPFSVELLSQFASTSRAVADMLGAGQRID